MAGQEHQARFNLSLVVIVYLKHTNTMKKLIYIAVIALSTALAFSSCTEEEVAPVSETNNGGTGTSSQI
jgi:hypothetical protein